MRVATAKKKKIKSCYFCLKYENVLKVAVSVRNMKTKT